MATLDPDLAEHLLLEALQAGVLSCKAVMHAVDACGILLHAMPDGTPIPDGATEEVDAGIEKMREAKRVMLAIQLAVDDATEGL